METLVLDGPRHCGQCPGATTESDLGDAAAGGLSWASITRGANANATTRTREVVTVTSENQ